MKNCIAKLQDILRTEPVLVRSAIAGAVVAIAAALDIDLGSLPFGLGEEALVGIVLTWLGLSARARVVPVAKGEV